MWYEYLIPANSQEQSRIIQTLRLWITGLEERGLIVGFAFNHYYSHPPDRDELRIRFEYSNDNYILKVEGEFQGKIREFIRDYVVEKRIWNEGTTPENVLRAYEFGSRCAFLLWKQIEGGKIKDIWMSDFIPFSNPEQIAAFDFQQSVNHGLWNSLLVHKSPNELMIHLFLLIQYAELHDMKELRNWLETNIQACEYFLKFTP
jgi:hypothetical protein